MQIHKCIATKPGVCANSILFFENPITIVYGKNDSGKSLLARAMVDTLWGDFNNKFLLNGSTWDDLYLEVFFATPSGQYRFIRDGKRAFTIKQIKNLVESDIFKRDLTINSDTARAMHPAFLPAALISDKETARLFSRIDVEKFRNISLMPSPMEISKDGSVDYNSFQWLILDDRSNFYSLYNNILAELSREGFKGSVENYMINDVLRAESAVKEFDRKLQIIEIQNGKTARLHNERKRLNEEIDALKDDLRACRGKKGILYNVLGKYSRLEELEDVFNSKREEVAVEKEKIDSYQKLLEDTKIKYKQFIDFNEKNFTNLKKIESAYSDVRNIYEAIEKHNLDKKRRRSRIKRLLISLNIYSLLIAFSVFYLITDRLMLLKIYKYYFFSGVLFLLAAISLLIFLVYLSTNRKKEIKKLMGDRVEIESKLENLLVENNIFLDEYRLDILYEFLVQYFEEYAEYSIRQSEIENSKKELKQENYIQSLEKEIEDDSLEAEELRIEIADDLKGIDLPEDREPGVQYIKEKIQGINSLIKSIKKNIRDNQKLISQISGEIVKVNGNVEERDDIIAKKKRAEDELGKLYDYKKAITCVIEVLEDAVESRRDSQLNRFVKIVKDKFHYLTDSQYNNIVDNKFIKDIISGKATGESLNPSVFYMLLLSIKIAATYLLHDFDMALPLIIDEPFLFSDERRALRLKQLLDEISEMRQVIIFTHNSNYNDWGSFIKL